MCNIPSQLDSSKFRRKCSYGQIHRGTIPYIPRELWVPTCWKTYFVSHVFFRPRWPNQSGHIQWLQTNGRQVSEIASHVAERITDIQTSWVTSNRSFSNFPQLPTSECWDDRILLCAFMQRTQPIGTHGQIPDFVCQVLANRPRVKRHCSKQITTLFLCSI